MHPRIRTAALAALAGLLVAGGTAAQTRGTMFGVENRFIGSDTCGACHQEALGTWKDTYHAKMVRTPREGLLKDALDNWAKDAKGNAGPTKANISGAPAKLDDVVYVVGSKWKQRYLVPNPQTGNHQFLDKQWNRASGTWEPYGQKNDWETQCSTCHATGYRAVSVGEKNAILKASMSEKNIGCEACHGPGLRHANSRNKADIFNPRNASKAEADKVCGYCHIRGENEFWRTAQGNAAEQLPHPVAGESYKAGSDDWTTWYPDKYLLPGVHADDAIGKNYPNTDLNNAFYIDDAAQKSGYFEALKHHQQYQEHLQSKHAKAGLLSCIDCHSSHGVQGKQTVAAQTCTSCHGASMDAKKMMPGLAQTAGGLMMRSHAFNPNPRAPRGTTADQLPPPEYAYPQK
ncbi:MAG TPA: multiheme c-type cytochrome [Casimicrobiaceae bacterium]|nr:multiheme c-type cytochrome [Casimicrobiaceae bacterium]